MTASLPGANNLLSRVMGFPASLTPPQVSKQLNIARSTVTGWIRDGLKTQANPAYRLIAREDLFAFLRSQAGTHYKTEAARLKAISHLESQPEQLYTVRGLSRALNVKRETAAGWIESGLKTQENPDYSLIARDDLLAFLQDRADRVEAEEAARKAEEQERTRQPRPYRTAGRLQKARGLLPMDYKPSEIAEELNVTIRTIYNSWIPAGLPAQVDDTGHYWLNGVEVRSWFESFTRKDKPAKLTSENDFYCVSCAGVVTVEKYRRKTVKNNRGICLKSGACPSCGHKVHRFAALEESK